MTAARILFLENDPHYRELVNEALKGDGLACEMIVAKTREEFQSALRQTKCDVIMADFASSAYNGMAALAAARELQPEMPFIFVSGTIGEERAGESFESGATDYVLKDRLDRLGPAVRRALREAGERQRRRQAEESLKESEARFRQVAGNIDEVFWLADSKTNQMLYISPAYEKIWGRTGDSLYREPHSWINAVHPDDRDRVLKAALAKPVLSSYDETYRVVRPDGSLRWVHHRAYPIRNEAGEICRVVGTAEDITERRLLEQQFHQAQKMEAIGQLAGGVAHDFNNLLIVIRGNAELVLMDAQQLGDEARECLKQVIAAAERAAGLTRQLFAFGRKQIMQPRPLNLTEVIGNLSKMLGRIIGEDIRLRCEGASELPLVQADVGMMEQVLFNLAVNARDAMPRGGQLLITTGQVHFDEAYARNHPEARTGEFVCLTMSDTGTGIAPEHLPRIFEPFFTTKEPGKGTGLGLATVYGIAKQHQGWVEVSSRPGAGACFKVFLPAIPAATATAKSPQLEPAPRGGNETILLVEDDPSVRMVARRTLETFGYRVLEAISGREAHEVWSRHAAEIDLLLTDVVMPDGMTGRELAEGLQAQKRRLKVIFTSGYSPDVAGKDTDFVRRSMDHFLQKPYPSRVLLESVRLCLDGK